MTFRLACGISFYACAPLAHGKRLGENLLKFPRASPHSSYIFDAMLHKLKVPQPSQSLICVFYTDCHALLDFPSPVCDLESDFKQNAEAFVGLTPFTSIHSENTLLYYMFSSVIKQLPQIFCPVF